jgi:membrane fusion protein, multidrug efflux system
MATSVSRTRWILVGVGAAAIVAIAWLLLHRKPAQAHPPPPVPVAIAQATTQDFPVTVTSLGAAQAWKSVTIFAQVSGVLLSVNFKEGSDVTAGQVLAEVDPSTYRAALTQTQGQLAHDQAVLAEARNDLVRYKTLLAQDSIARQLAENQVQVVKQAEGTVLLDKGLVENARINLSRCRIVSPIPGRTGVRLVDPGNLVNGSGSVSSLQATAGPTSSASPTGTSTGLPTGSVGSSGSGIVVINQIEPIAVTFTVPQADFQQLQQTSDDFARPLMVQAFSQETGALIDTGRLEIADNRVNPATGTVALKADFPNAGHQLWPGLFINVRLTLQTLPGAVVVPSTAVNRGPQGQFVFVVGPGNRAFIRPVKVGASDGASTTINSGLRSGELVVVDGQMTLKDGSQIRVAQRVAVGAARP